MQLWIEPMSVYQNLYGEWDETIERGILKKFNVTINYLNIIAFRTMLEEGLNSIDELKDHIDFIKLFPIYLFNTNSVPQAIDDPTQYWKSSCEYDLCIPLHAHNFYKIGNLLYYIDY